LLCWIKLVNIYKQPLELEPPSSICSYLAFLLMKALPVALVQDIISLRRSGHSFSYIQSKTGAGHASISRICSEHCPDVQKSLGGRPKKLSEADVRHAVRLVTSTKSGTAVQAARVLGDITNQPLSAETVRRGLKKMGMKAKDKEKKPLLLSRHRAARLEWAQKHKDWTIEDWKTIVWSDETKINRLGSDGRQWVWMKKGEKRSERTVKSTVKFGGGSVMMWGCMTWWGVGYACRIEGTMDKYLYVSILEDELLASLEYHGLDVEEMTFQQDGDPKHRSGLATEWFSDHGMKVMDWPAQSPDLNPIEHLWSHIKRELGKYEEPPKGIIELWSRVEKVWEETPEEVCQNLIRSMPSRVEAVLQARGGHTKY
jgi:transposase